MNIQAKPNTGVLPEDYWRGEGGDKWVEYIDKIEASISAFGEATLERAALKNGDMVLDVGCGGGMTSIEIARRVAPTGSVTGIDISTPILKIAKQRGKSITNLRFLEADAAIFEFEQENYDVIFSRFGIMFFSDRKRAFANLYHALKPTGRMVFICWRSLEVNPWINTPTQAIFSVIPPQGPPPDPDAPGPFSLADQQKIEDLLSTVGLKEITADPADLSMSLGTLDEAVEYLMRMGSAAAALAEASDEQKSVAAEAVREAMKKFETSEGICPPASAWIITARR